MKRLRKLKGWNQTMLAEAAGLEQSTISKIENGWDGATLRNLNYIAQALGVPTYQLFLDDVSDAEIRIIEVYRSLSDDRKRGWQDMAQSVLARSQTDARSES
ncbi:DNA-binding transcriptional regulator, XRE-family HTH domain [Ruegeria lacuscaerulensis ITI-1157]|nr:DNA-binding transcriptional regulator, XRE-family HTH domain [Ruegeria lacuscaerulensis ITI-1157]